MKTSDIKYDLSRDYKKLHGLLKSDNVIIGFIALSVDGVSNFDYSKVTTMSYDPEFKKFDVGCILFESDFSKEDFMRFCKKENVQFFDL